MTTGIGRRRIRRPKKSMPSIRGISTSSVMTSRLSLPNHFSRNQGIIRCPYALHIPLAIDDFGEQTTRQGRVIDHYHPNFFTHRTNPQSKQIHRSTRITFRDEYSITPHLLCNIWVRMRQSLDHCFSCDWKKHNLPRINIQHIL